MNFSNSQDGAGLGHEGYSLTPHIVFWAWGKDSFWVRVVWWRERSGIVRCFSDAQERLKLAIAVPGFHVSL